MLGRLLCGGLPDLLPSCLLLLQECGRVKTGKSGNTRHIRSFERFACRSAQFLFVAFALRLFHFALLYGILSLNIKTQMVRHSATSDHVPTQDTLVLKRFEKRKRS